MPSCPCWRSTTCTYIQLPLIHSLSACNGCQIQLDTSGPFDWVICLILPHNIVCSAPILPGRNVLQLNRPVSLKSLQKGINFGPCTDNAYALMYNCHSYIAYQPVMAARMPLPWPSQLDLHFFRPIRLSIMLDATTLSALHHNRSLHVR